jgi:signal transduction histidine kinase
MCPVDHRRHAEDLAAHEHVLGAEPGAALAEPDEWLRYAFVWHAVMVALAILTGVLVVVDDGVAPASRYVALAVIAGLSIWYALAGRRALRRHNRWGTWYLLVAAPVTVGLLAVAPVGGLMLFGLYPHIWAMLPPRRATVVTVGVVAAVAAVVTVRTPVRGSAGATALVVGAVSLVIALLLGLWIASIIRQSGRRASLLAELAATRAELASLSRAAGVLTERERLAREIHDTLAQGYTSVLLLLEAVQTALDTDPAAARRHLDRARATARENLAEARALVAELTPPDLSQTSLPEALRRIVERVDTEAGLRAAFEVAGTPYGLPADHEVTLLRSAQEALTNVRRHAGAGRVEVSLAYAPGGVSLRVRDDGGGFDVERSGEGGYGLAGMRARAGQVGGALSIVSAPGQGTAVRVDIPVP